MYLDFKPLTWFLFLLLSGVSCYSDFEIFVPNHVQVGVYGKSVVLSCTFPVNSLWDADSTVITWQRQLEVIHSFYHGKDQMLHQSQRYTNRTSLFHQEMKRGNASLRLDHARLDDAGEYTCSVSTQKGSQKKSFGLKIAAYYLEPLLHISVLNDGHMELLVTSEGGFPSPTLQWLMGTVNDVTNDTQTQLRRDEHTQLYIVNSKLKLTSSVNSSITIILKNQELGQKVQRNINLLSENRRPENKVKAVIIGLSVLVGVTYVIGFIVSVLCIRRQWMQRIHSEHAAALPRLRFFESLQDLNHQKIPKTPSTDKAKDVTVTLLN